MFPHFITTSQLRPFPFVALLSLVLFQAEVRATPIDTEGKKITSKVASAKVFLSGAQVSRTASTSIPAGASTLIFTGLTQHIDPQSLQVTGKGGYTILSVNHRINHLSESPKKKEIEELQDRIKKLEKDWAYEKAMQDVWVNEEQLLNKNSSIAGQQNGLTAAQLTGVNDYVRERLKVTKTNWLAQQEKLTNINTEAEKLRKELAQYQSQAPAPTSEVVVEITSTAEVSASFVLTYFSPSASWLPAYDLRAKSTGQPIELLMKAQVTNSTGEDWSKVDLSLSSGNPTLGGVMPVLNPWTLYTYRPQQIQRSSS
ncbi:MAG TPA: mucoidy inhibitor MuiA family protein, partial [Flavobacteriales bacterium]|nr:mucoidy inhibitor MuiA family protein [Flavobacteriales bacterium]